MNQLQGKKILFVISNLAIGGGAEKVVSMLATRFLEEGISTTMLTFYESPKEHPFSGERLSMHENAPASVLMKLPRALKRIWKVKQVCREKNIDVVISFLEESNYYSLLSKIFLFNKVPMIVSVRNDPTKYNKIYKILIRFLYPHAQKVISVTKGVEEVLRKNFNLSNVSTIYNPVNWEYVIQKSKEMIPDEYAWLKERSPLFVTIGRLARQKGQWHLIRAFSEVVREEPGATLAILGEGSYRDILQSYIVDLKLEKNVFLIGRQENVYPFLKMADVFVFSSLWEGMPNVLLEALTARCRIVATEASTGVREILAPELDISQSIDYPYRTDYGTLLQPWYDLDAMDYFRKPITASESVFAHEMLVSLRHPHPKDFPNDERFSIEHCVNYWKNFVLEICK